jgi:hypothetical protein
LDGLAPEQKLQNTEETRGKADENEGAAEAASGKIRFD